MSNATAPPAVGVRPNRPRTLLAVVAALGMAIAAVLGLGSASAAPPAITIDAPTAVSYTSAHLSGKIDTSDLETAWTFQVSTDGFNWNAVGSGTIPAGEGSTQVEVEADATGLEDGVAYFARLSATNFEEFTEYFSAEPNPEFTTVPMAAPVATIDTPSAVTSSSAHFSGTVSPEAPVGGPAEFDVSWHFECSPECPGLSGGTVPAGSPGPVPVEADASGLLPGVSYEVTLVAANAGNTVGAGPEGFATPAVGPTLSAISAHPAFTEATLRGSIDPGGAAVTYHFDYGPTGAYGRSTTAAVVPAGNGPVAVSAVANGLDPASTYHYRLVAGNSAGSAASDDGTFATASSATGPDPCPNAAIRAAQGSAWLPDCRAFELTNPPGIEIADVLRSPAIGEDGNRVAWASPAGPADATATRVNYVGVATRGPGGWVNTDSNLAEGEGEGGDPSSKPSAFSSDLSRELYFTRLSPDPADTNGTEDWYRFDVGTGAATALWASPVAGGTLTLAGASRDLSRVFTEYAPTSGSPHSEIVVWDAEHGARPVSLLPDGSKPESVAPGGYAHYPYWEALLGEAFPDIIAAHGGLHPVSNDGTKIFWIAFELSRPGPVYMRDTETEETKAISRSELPGEVGAAKEARFIAASPSGDVAFIETRSPLTVESQAAAPNGGIYRVNTETGAKELVAPVSFSEAGIGGNELEAAIASDDASHLYFATKRAVLPGAVEGESNVYAWSGGSLELVAVVPGEAKLERSSRDGRYMVFSTDAQVDGSSNDGQPALFEYDAATGKTACVSCRPDGSPSQGAAALQAQPFATGGFVFMSPTRNITDDGRVFFSSTDRIVAGDRTAARDVYEYDHGTVSLLTPGRGDDDSFLFDNSDDGRNVFIATRSPLVAADRDANQLDLYDVRVDGGFPVQGGDPGPAPCEGESCQGQPLGAPAATAPASRMATAGKARHRKARHHGRKARHRGHRSKGKHRHTHRDREVGR